MTKSHRACQINLTRRALPFGDLVLPDRALNRVDGQSWCGSAMARLRGGATALSLADSEFIARIGFGVGFTTLVLDMRGVVRRDQVSGAGLTHSGRARRGDHMQHDETSGALDAFRRYTDAFRALDARAVAQFFYEPAVLITPREVLALPTATAVEQTYARLMADMPPDYDRTEFSPFAEHRLSDDLAMVSGSGVWKNAANEDLMPFGMTYTLRRNGQTWRVVVAAIHAPNGGHGR